MKQILKKIKEYNTIIIEGHKRPDGDSIGSSYGLMYLIKDSFPDKNVYVTGESSEYVSFIGSPTLIDEELFKDSLIICVDCAVQDRLVDNRIHLSKYSIKIDHHIKEEMYCDYEYIDDKASSVAQIITEFYMNFKDELVMSDKCAEALYVGLLTDSNRFKNDNVNSKTFICASELIKHNINLRYIENYLSSERLEVLKLKGYCLNNFSITESGFAYITLTKEVIKSFNVTLEEAASLVGIISTIKDVPVWAILLETEKEIRVRLRSKGPDINKLANMYNGGGHKLASGAKLNNWEILDKFVNDADELVKVYKKNLI